MGATETSPPNANQSFASFNGQSDPFASDPFSKDPFQSSTPTQQSGVNRMPAQSSSFQHQTSASSSIFSSVFENESSASTAPVNAGGSSTMNNAFTSQTAPPTTQAQFNGGDQFAALGDLDKQMREMENDSMEPALNLGRGIPRDAVIENESKEPTLNLGRGLSRDVVVVDSTSKGAVSQPASLVGFQPTPLAVVAQQAPPQAPPKVEDPFADDFFSVASNSTKSDPFGTPVSVNKVSSLKRKDPPSFASLTVKEPQAFDPFDTSTVRLPFQPGPFQQATLQPWSIKQEDIFSSSPPISVIPENNSPEKSDKAGTPDLPSPNTPPPPLPVKAALSVQIEVPPPPPPRPGLRKQHTIDVCLSQPAPAPPPRTAAEKLKPSPILCRQRTVDSTVQSSQASPPALPPRPGSGERRRPPLNRADTLPCKNQSLTLNYPASTKGGHRRKKSGDAKTFAPSGIQSIDPFACNLSHSRSSRMNKMEGVVSRPRPRPRSRTPAGGSTQSPLSTRSQSPYTTDSMHSGSPRGSINEADLTDRPENVTKSPGSLFNRSHLTNSTDERSGTPSSVKSESAVDPFVEVDPFAKDPFSNDPFMDQPDPFTMDSPSSDPFSKDFSQSQVFHTRIVSVDKDPFSDDPFTETSAKPENKFPTAFTNNISVPSTRQFEVHKSGSNISARQNQFSMDPFVIPSDVSQYKTLSKSAPNTDFIASARQQITTNHVNIDDSIDGQSEDDLGISVANQNFSNNWRDGDSSSNSEISDAFAGEGLGSSSNLQNGVGSKPPTEPLSLPLQRHDQVRALFALKSCTCTPCSLLRLY